MAELVLEGTWEEISLHASEFAGRRVRLTVLSNNEGVFESPKNGAELVAYWDREGLFGTRPDISDSVEYAQALRRKAETRLRGQ